MIEEIWIASCNKAFGKVYGTTYFQSEMNNDHFNGDPDYSWDAYIQSSCFENWRRAREVCLK